mgnify:CR=1 FL=1
MQGPWASLGGWGRSPAMGTGMGNQWMGWQLQQPMMPTFGGGGRLPPGVDGMYGGGMAAQPMPGGMGMGGLPPWLAGGMMPQQGAMPPPSFGMRPPSWTQPMPAPQPVMPQPAPSPMQPQPMPAKPQPMRPQPMPQRSTIPQLALADDPALSRRMFMAANRG